MPLAASCSHSAHTWRLQDELCTFSIRMRCNYSRNLFSCLFASNEIFKQHSAVRNETSQDDVSTRSTGNGAKIQDHNLMVSQQWGLPVGLEVTIWCSTFMFSVWLCRHSCNWTVNSVSPLLLSTDHPQYISGKSRDVTRLHSLHRLSCQPSLISKGYREHLNRW